MRRTHATFIALTALATGCASVLGIDESPPARQQQRDAGTISAPTREASAASQDAAASGTSLASDPENCGRVGHSCGGGACSAGVCQSMVYVYGQTKADFIAKAADTLFWTAGNELRACIGDDCRGGAQVLKSSPDRTWLMPTTSTRVDAPWFAEALGSPDFFRCGAGAACARQEVPAGAQVAGMGDGEMFVSQRAPNNTLIFGCNESCTQLASVPRAPFVTMVYGSTQRLVYAQAFQAGEYAIVTCERDRCDQTATTLLKALLGMLWSNGRHAVWTTNEGIRWCELPACTRVVGSPYSQGGRTFVVTDKYVYFADTARAAVYRCPLDHCDEPEPIVTSEPWPVRLAADDKYLYWLRTDSGEIRRIALP